MVARFPVDNQVYRAKVTAVRKGPDHQTTRFNVLFIDYGNSCQDLSQDDLWMWDPLYEMIQPQAHLCSFKEFPKAWKEKSDVFHKVMTSQGAMKMHIFQVSPSPCGFFKASVNDFDKVIELVVSLTTVADKDVCEVLASHCSILGQHKPAYRSLREKRTAGLESLDVSPSRFVSAPPPYHLQNEQGRPSLSPPPSPTPPQITVRAVQKVLDWDCTASQTSDGLQDEEEVERRTLKRSWRGTQEGKVGRSLLICVCVLICFFLGYLARGYQIQRWRRNLNLKREILNNVCKIVFIV